MCKIISDSVFVYTVIVYSLVYTTLNTIVDFSPVFTTLHFLVTYASLAD